MRERVQVNTRLQGPEALRPVSSPNIVTVNAQRRDTSGGIAASLANALGIATPVLQAEMDERNAKFKQDESNRAYDRIQGMTFEEATAAVKDGKLREAENPWFDAAFRKQYGIVYAGQRKRAILDSYINEFDQDNGDIEQFITGFVNDDAQQFGGDEFIRAGLREGMGNFLTSFRDKHAEGKALTRKDTATQRFLDVAREKAVQAVSGGGDVVTAVRGLYDSHRSMLGLTFGQMDDMTLSLAAEFAEQGDEATARALLETEVTGSDGQKVGSFLTREKHAAKANKIIAQAEANRSEQDRTKNISGMVELRQRAGSGTLTDADKAMVQVLADTKVISPEAATSILDSNLDSLARAKIEANTRAIKAQYGQGVANLMLAGKGWQVTDTTFTDANGKEITLKADAALQAAVDDTIAGMAQSGYSVSQIAGTMASWGVEQTSQQWENALSNGFLALHASLSKVGKDGTFELPEPAAAGYQLFKDMAEYPALRARHISDKSAMNLFMDAEVLERHGMDPSTALLTAARVDPNENRNSLTGRMRIEELESEVRSASAPGGYLWGMVGTDDVVNGNDVSAGIERHARILMDLGLPAKAAVKEAGKRFSDTHVAINGVMVNHRNKVIPAYFAEASEFLLSEFATLHGEDMADLTLVPTHNGENTWLIANHNLVPHPLFAQGGSFTMNQIKTRWEAVEQARRDKLFGDAKKSRAPNPTITTPLPSAD